MTDYETNSGEGVRGQLTQRRGTAWACWAVMTLGAMLFSASVLINTVTYAGPGLTSLEQLLGIVVDVAAVLAVACSASLMRSRSVGQYLAIGVAILIGLACFNLIAYRAGWFNIWVYVPHWL